MVSTGRIICYQISCRQDTAAFMELSHLPGFWPKFVSGYLIRPIPSLLLKSIQGFPNFGLLKNVKLFNDPS
jgi:hypothetical protein